MAETQYYEGLGRRKTATARVRLHPGGDGTILVNNQPVDKYFCRDWDLKHLSEPLIVTNNVGRFNVTVVVKGLLGRAGCTRRSVRRWR